MHRQSTAIAALVLAGLVWIAIAIIAASGKGEVRPSTVAGGLMDKVAQQTSGLEQALRGVIGAAPTVRDQVVSSVQTAIIPTPDGRGLTSQVSLILTTLAGLIFLPVLIGWRFRAGLLRSDGDATENPVFLLLLRDALSIAVMISAGFLAVRILFPSEAPLDRLAVAMIWGVIRWWIAFRVIDIVLRPGWPPARLLPASDSGARAAARLGAIALGIGICFISIAPILLGGGLKAPAARALALAVGLTEGLIALLALKILFRNEPRPARWTRVTLYGAIIALVAIWSASVLALEFSAYHSILLCLEALGIAYILDRLLVVGGSGLVPEYTAAIRRIVWLATVAAALFGLAKLLLVQVFHTVGPEAWIVAERGYTNAFLIIAIGFAMYEGMKAWAAVKFGAAHAVPAPGDEHAGKAVSRFATVMPIAIGFGGTIIIAISVILALAELGVSVGPILAGASIIGLAFSFGSQALVRDIVSGMFYMVDDAFRIGEYIDTGRHKGTVEKISLRAVRLRHHNGQFHNVPYGQFGAVTNFSRDWMTLKFNLRLARNVDVDRVRKLTKTLGQQLLEHPDIGTEFLVPLKLQGLIDIQENALVLRFKFTVKPTEPTIVRREVVSRLFQMFNENGLMFAEHAVTVRSITADASEDAAAATLRVTTVVPLPAA